MKTILATAAIGTLLTAPSAMADQYLARIDAPIGGATAGLLESLKVTEIDAFSHDGAHYVVIEAPDEGYVEAYFFALHRSPSALFTLGADWTGEGLADLTLDQRLRFLTRASCDFCVS